MEASEMSGPSPWTEERDEQLADFWGDGLTTSEIGRRMGIGKNSVIGRAHRLRLPSRGSPINLAASQSWAEADDATLRQLYGGFLTAAEIGARMGRTTHAIAYRAKFLGLVAGRRAKQTGARTAFMRSSAGRDAISPQQSRPVTTCRPSAAQPGAAAATAHGGSSFRNLPEVAAMPPRVFSGTECKYPLHGDDRPVVPRFCAEPVRDNAKGCASPYCAAHYAECYATPGKYPINPPPATWLKNRGMVWVRG
jgi:GcrA cell cycle regulator